MKSISEYKLKQQTPMIHFQGTETGACLRASEVKPKLDKFLAANAKVKHRWYVDKEKSEALNYKIKIEPMDEPKVFIPERPREKGVKSPFELQVYFGNMGKGEKKHSVMYERPIKLKIVCFDEELMAIIQEHLPGFFLLNNFGTRQNMGLGSFVISGPGAQKKPVEILPNYVGEERQIYRIQYDERTRIDQIFEDIATFSKVLKSGYNFNKTYVKSYLVAHCLNAQKHKGKRLGGDKRWLKEKLNMVPKLGKSAEEIQHYPVDEYYYNRALLGSAGSLSFINELDESGKPKKEKGKEEITITGKGGVERIPSPILYKVVGKELYIIVKKPTEAIYGSKFAFSNKRGREEVLTVPEKDKVDIQEVFADYVDDINKKSYEYDNLKKLLVFLRQGKKIEIVESEVK